MRNSEINIDSSGEDIVKTPSSPDPVPISGRGKHQITNPKQYDLEERTFRFAERCRDFVKKLPKTIANIE